MLIAKANQVAEFPDSQHVGTLKKRQEFVLTLDKVIPIQMGYAVALYMWHDRDNNQLVWFASRDSLDYETGQEYRIKATVKSHRVYQGTKQTVINRLNLVETMYRPFVQPDIEQTSHEQAVNEAWELL